MTAEQIIISIDRLTRFKYTEDKYFRVFSDVILSNLISPKIKKKDLEKLDYITIKNYAEQIFNYSLKSLGVWVENDFIINKKLFDYESSMFNLSDNTKLLLSNKINYKSAIKLIKPSKTLPKNLSWLMILDQNVDFDTMRKLKKLHFPIKKLVLTEGITEEILIPEFSKKCSVDFDESGIHIISAGGKNQVVKLFYFFSEIIKIPVFILLDKDAEENYLQIEPRLRKNDKIHLLNCGEFEDILPKRLIKKTLNNVFKNFATVGEEELNVDLPMVKILENLFKLKGLNEFKKAEFAQLVHDNISDEDDISEEIRLIINEINDFSVAFS